MKPNDAFEIILEKVSNNSHARKWLHDSIQRANYSRFNEYFCHRVPNVRFLGMYGNVPFFETRSNDGVLIYTYTAMVCIDHKGNVNPVFVLGSDFSINDMSKYFYSHGMHNLVILTKLVNRQVHYTNIVPQNPNRVPKSPADFMDMMKSGRFM